MSIRKERICKMCLIFERGFVICLFLVEINVRHLKFYILHFFYIGNPFQYYLKPCSSIFDKDYSTYFMIFARAGLITWP